MWPDGQFLPVYGAYSDAPWDPKPGKLAPNEAYLFRFKSRSSGNRGAIEKDSGAVQTSADTPFLTAEVGAGIQDTYVRRPVVSRDDVAAIDSVMIGSGANLLGYYMFQGGENPDGEKTTLNESKATGYPTDVPIKSYDFQAPLGEFGLERPSYGALKLFNYFLDDFGAELAPMRVFAPADLPKGADDMQTLRVSVRADQNSGFLFVNNHVRGYSMKSHSGVQFRIALGNNSTLTIPARPVAIPAGSYFIWPLRMKIGSATMTYSTAQPMCKMTQGNTTVWIFSEVPGIKAEFAFPRNQAKLITVEHGTERQFGDVVVISGLVPGLAPVLKVVDKHGANNEIVLLSRDHATRLTKVKIEGVDHLVMSRAEVFSNGHTMTLRSLND
ncbi:MAG TPA: glycoside hydrolase, partial [Terriglobia bacterium]|nr:glycoside hydrolase [Terriglobia bacterium]